MTVATTLLALATLASPQSKGAPNPLSIAYSGVPSFVVMPNVRMDSHSVTIEVSEGSMKVETLTLFKNLGGEAMVKAKFPWLSYATNNDFRVPPSTLKATWDKVPMKLESDWRGLGTIELSDRYRQKVYLADAVFKANATHALRVEYTVPLGRGGLDNLLRVASYGLEFSGDWRTIGRFQISVKTVNRQVFQVYSATPDWGWQIGASGAFLRRDAFEAQGVKHLLFAFYPGGFGDIGGRGSTGGGGGLR